LKSQRIALGKRVDLTESTKFESLPKDVQDKISELFDVEFGYLLQQ
jgi:hypothetical protein